MISYSHSNELALLHRGAEFFPALVRACEQAHAEIFLETYIFALDEIFVIHVEIALDHDAAARRCMGIAHGLQLILDDVEHAQARPQNVEIVCDLGSELGQSVRNFVATQSRQTLQAQQG